MALLSGPPVQRNGALSDFFLEVPLSFAASLASVFRNYANFNGRARRSEFWWFTLAAGIVSWALAAWEMSSIDLSTGEIGSGYALSAGISGLFGLALLLPTLAVQVRRLHDIGKSGGWWFFVLIPVVGPIMMIVWYATAGTVGPNRFGEDPKAVATSPAPATV